MTAVINSKDVKAMTLRQLMHSCYQAEARFRFAAAAIDDGGIKHLFEIYAKQRIRFAAELREHVPGDSDHADSWQQAAADCDEPVPSTSDCVRQCVHTNARALDLYREALADRALPTRAHFLISAQLALMEPVHNRVSLLLQQPLNPAPQGARNQTISA